MILKNTIRVAVQTAAFYLSITASLGQSVEIRQIPDWPSNFWVDSNFCWEATYNLLLKRDATTGELLEKIPLPYPAYRSAYDGNGTFWFSMDSLVGRYDGVEWTTWSAANEPAFGGNLAYANYIAVRQNGEVWVTTGVVPSTASTWFFDGSVWHEEPFLKSTYSYGLAAGPNDELVFCGQDSMFLKQGNNPWQAFVKPPGGSSAAGLPTFDRNGKLWVHTNKSYYRYDNLGQAPPTLVTTDFQFGHYPLTIAFDELNNLFVGLHAGLARFDGSGWLSLQPAAGISSNNLYVTAIGFGAAGQMWTGLTRYHSAFTSLLENGVPVKNFFDDIFSANMICRSRNGDLWLAGFMPIITRVKKSNDSLEFFSLYDLVPQFFDYVTDRLIPGKGDDMWMISKSAGILHFDGSSWAKFPLAGFPTVEELDMAVDNTGQFYVRGYNPSSSAGAVHRFDTTGQPTGIIDFSSLSPGVAPFVKDLEVDEANNLWFVSNLGLGKLTPDSTLEIFPTPFSSPSSIYTQRILGVSAGMVYFVESYFASIPKLYHFNDLTDQLTLLNWPEMPPGFEWQNNYKMQATIDLKGRLWLTYSYSAMTRCWFFENNEWTEVSPFPVSPVNSIAADGHNNVFFGSFHRIGILYIEGLVNGVIRRDTDNNCQPGPTDLPMPTVVVQGDDGANQYFGISHTDGSYKIFPASKTVSVQPVPPNDLWQVCPPGEVTLTVNPDSATVQDFLLEPVVECPLLSVELTAVGLLRRCFDNQYLIKACNNGTATATTAFVDIQLPPGMTFVNSTLPVEILSPVDLRFQLGDLKIGECRQISMTVHIDCDSTVLGQTLCVSAHVFPDSICYAGGLWKGATVLLSAACEADSVRFSLKNAGLAAMSGSLPFKLLRNLSVEETGQFALAAGQTRSFSAPKTGDTWRLLAAQEPGHPFQPRQPSIAVEGCWTGGGIDFQKGFVTMFPNGDGSAFSARECNRLVGSFDPNDKSTTPEGVGENEHRIAPGTEISYLIRFQNTGTDTAFTVVVHDTLPPGLDVSTLQIGASSHLMEVELRDRALVFRFENILLPDSNVNEAASHGFVRFRIRPLADLPLGTALLNRAAIYFDFNEAVKTNTTWLVVDDISLVSDTKNPFSQPDRAGMFIAPNPTGGPFVARPPTAEAGFFELFDGQGRLIFRQPSAGSTSPVSLECHDCAAGLFLLRFRSAASGRAWTEKLSLSEKN